MKRFGVQLAAGGVVILLGALGVAQAQRDSQKSEPDEWDVQAPPAMSAPVPIAAAEESPAPLPHLGDAPQASDSPSMAYAGGESYAASEPAGAPPAMANAAFAYPAAVTGAGPEFAGGQAAIQQVAHEAFALPPQAVDAAAEQPADAAPYTATPYPAVAYDDSAAPPADPTAETPSPAFAADGFEPADFAPEAGAPTAESRASNPESGLAEAFSSDPAADPAASGPLGFALPQSPSTAADAETTTAEPEPAAAEAREEVASSEPAGPLAPLYQDMAAAPPSEATEQTPEPEAAEPEAAEPAAAAELMEPQAAEEALVAEEPQPAEAAELQFASQPVNELRDPPALAAEGPSNYAADAPFGAGLRAMATESAAAPLAAMASPETPANAAAPSEVPYNEAPYNAAPYGAVAAANPPAATGQPAPAPRQLEAFESRQPTAAEARPLEPTAAEAVAHVASVMPAPLGLAPQTLETLLNEPGDRRLEGRQSPSIAIQKRAPEEVKVGKPASFVIQIQNVGGVEALGVQVHDRVPAGMRLIEASPQPQQHGDILIWQLGALEPGGERTVSMQLLPEQEGELGSVARVTFEAAAAVRTISTRPALQITQRAPERVLIGQQLEIELEVSNPGTGAATGVIMQEDVPEGLEHPKGRQLDNLIGTLGPGEVRRQILRLRAVAPGMVENHIRLVGDDGLTAEHRINVEVIAPELAVELDGPSRRFLERQATYHVNLANLGAAEATNVEIVAYLDRGFTFVGTEYQGQYDPSRHAVYWSLAELPPEGRGSVPLTLLPIEQGERAIRLEARGDLNVLARHEKKVNIDALAELTFSITDDADPIEVGSIATYEIRLTNRGSGDDGDVALKLQLPPGLELVSSDNDASTDGRGLVVFAPQSVMAARSEVVHRVRVKGVTPGTHVVKATVASREAPVEVTKEESTTVYADE